jgi:hypothetical protein
MMDAGSKSACGEYSHCRPDRSFSLTFETWHGQLHTNGVLSGFLADGVRLNWIPYQRKEAMSQAAPRLAVLGGAGQAHPVPMPNTY